MFADAEALLQQELEPGEQLFWAGRPKQGIRLQPADALLIPFSLVWGGGVVFWEAMVIHSGAPLYVALFGIPFVLFGVFLIFGRFLLDARRRANTIYGLTDRRILVITGVSGRRVTSLNLHTLTDVTMTERSGGSGTLTFGAGSNLWTWVYGWYGWFGSGTYGPPCLENIENVREVYQAIVKLQHAAAS